jgi:hypothetical protein
MGWRLFKGLKALLGIVFLFSGIAHSEIQSPLVPNLQELSTQVADRITRVEEFKFIRNEAEKLGVRAYLFGGTAAGYAHYVKWDLQREKGDTNFQPDRFDYDYTNIYRSTQDLDIVIDGNAKQAAQLQSALEQKYPHLQGNKTAWEVRLLTQDMGDKLAILNNPDFMNQHTDSNSTGLIEISKPRAGDTAIKDIRDWKSSEPYFLKDVHEGTLHYYFSPLHETTKFAKEGRNPPILSVIRYLTKAFQYDLKLKPEDLAQIKKVVDEFTPARDLKNSYVAQWIEKNGKKLFQNAVDIEYAWNTLETLGLRNKLIAIKKNFNQLDSLAWWMKKEPLRTSLVGQGSGKTAKQLGLDTVAHETSDFLAYESITRAHTGFPNVFISRDGIGGEAAFYGNGFYTAEGREGARGTGLTIRFRLAPDARDGTDFSHVNNEHYVIVLNKAALKVIPESLNIDPVEYFRLRVAQDLKLEESDGAIATRLERRIRSKMHGLSSEQQEGIARILKPHMNSERSKVLTHLIREWPELISDVLIHQDPVGAFKSLAQTSKMWSHFTKNPELYQKLKNTTSSTSFRLSEQENREIAIILENNAKSLTPNWELLQAWFSSPQSPEYSDELVHTLLQRKLDRSKVILDLLSQTPWKDHPLHPSLTYQKKIYQFQRNCAGQIKTALERLVRAAPAIALTGAGAGVAAGGYKLYDMDNLRPSEKEMLRTLKKRLATAKSISEVIEGIKLPDHERLPYDNAFYDQFDPSSVERLMSLASTPSELRQLADFTDVLREGLTTTPFRTAYLAKLRKSSSAREYLNLMHKMKDAYLTSGMENSAANEFLKFQPTSKELDEFIESGHYLVPPNPLLRHIIRNAKNMNDLMHPLTLSKEDIQRIEFGHGLVNEGGSFKVYEEEESSIEKFHVGPKELKKLLTSIFGMDEINLFTKIALKQATSKSQVIEIIQTFAGPDRANLQPAWLMDAFKQNASHLESLGMSEQEAVKLLRNALKL